MKFNFGILALLMVGLVAIAGTVSAFGGLGGIWPGESQGADDATRTAIETGDFSAWKAAVEAQLTEENFNLIVKRQFEMQQRGAEMEQRREYREAMRQAIEENDYEAWKEAAENIGLESEKILSEDDFALIVQLHQAREDQDTEAVAELMDEMDLAGITGFGIGPGMELGIRPEMGDGHRGMGPGHMGYGAGQLVEENSE